MKAFCDDEYESGADSDMLKNWYFKQAVKAYLWVYELIGKHRQVRARS